MKSSTIAAIREQTVQQSLKTIERRIKALGFTQPTIQRSGPNEDEILIRLPSAGDPARVKRIIQASGQLELKLVEDPTPYPSEAAAFAAHNGVMPAGTELVRGRSSTGNSSVPSGENWYLLDRAAIVTWRDLRGAIPKRSTKNIGFYDVEITFSREAGRRLGSFTERNLGRKMAIVLDHRVQTARVIQSRIEDAVRITGQFGREQAQDLALVLRAGALPASVKYLEEHTIPPQPPGPSSSLHRPDNGAESQDYWSSPRSCSRRNQPKTFGERTARSCE
jgi:preprotein translocase subunit SecD